MKKKKKSLKEISASIKRYYDTLTDEERAENFAWGEFATSQFTLISEEYDQIEDGNGCAPEEFQQNRKN